MLTYRRPEPATSSVGTRVGGPFVQSQSSSAMSMDVQRAA